MESLNRFAFVSLQFQSVQHIEQIESYSEIRNVAEDVTGNIRTVAAFGGEQLETERFDKLLMKAKKARKLQLLFTGINEGLVSLIYFLCYALALSYGVQLVLEDRDKNDKEYTPSVFMIVR